MIRKRDLGKVQAAYTVRRFFLLNNLGLKTTGPFTACFFFFREEQKSTSRSSTTSRDVLIWGDMTKAGVPPLMS